jgi:hypothetical protein
MTQLTTTLSQVLPNIGEDTNLEPSEVVTTDDSALRVIREAQDTCHRLDRLIRLISDNVGTCQIEHSLGIHLSGFSDQDGDMRVLLSTCPDSKGKIVWYPVECKVHL